LSLTKQQVDFTEKPGAPFGEIRFELAKKSKAKAKSERKRSIPMSGPVAEILRRRAADSRSDHLFIGTSLAQVVVALTRAFRRICEAAEIPNGYEQGGAVLHTLRHSAATYLSSLGLPIQDIAEILGHESITMSLKYMHSTPQGVGQALRALSQIGVRLEAESEPDEPDKPTASAGKAAGKSL
jgi:integrase